MLTQSELQALFAYCPISGVFTRLVGVKGHARGQAGCRRASGYRQIRILGRNYYEHRLAWLFMTGVWPKEIDHIDGDRANNAWNNLRVVNRSQNKQNMKRPTALNRVGRLGVSRVGKRFRAQIAVNGRKIGLGVFASAALAEEAYLAAKRVYHPSASATGLGGIAGT
jgi:hypothetical protein